LTAILLGYEDISAAREFFVSALGFVEEWSVRSEDGALTRSHVRFGDTVLMLDKPGAHGVTSPSQAGGVTHLVVVSVPDVDAHVMGARASGAEILSPPTNRPWGRDYELRDAGGYVFSFLSESD
jgi:uncharacterized glyoxalase superfamily protein PhnB